MKISISTTVALLTLAVSAFGASGLTGTAITNVTANDGSKALPANNLSVVVVDTARDGFAFSGGGLVEGLSLSVGSLVGTDDLIVANNSTSSFLGTSVVSGAAANIDNGSNGIDAGDPFAIFFFDGITATEDITIVGAFYGVATYVDVDIEDGLDGSWVVPANTQTFGFRSSLSEGNYQQLTGISADFTIIPEPSICALILGVLALTGAMIRRSS
ncbi:MAG: hypothetical protein ACON4O_09435 [Lentimonas sp.]